LVSAFAPAASNKDSINRPKQHKPLAGVFRLVSEPSHLELTNGTPVPLLKQAIISGSK
jgi:hypothetical protein